MSEPSKASSPQAGREYFKPTTHWRGLDSTNNLLLARYMQLLYEDGAVVTVLDFDADGNEIRLTSHRIGNIQFGLSPNGDVQVHCGDREDLGPSLSLPIDQGMFATEANSVVLFRIPYSPVLDVTGKLVSFVRLVG